MFSSPSVNQYFNEQNFKQGKPIPLFIVLTAAAPFLIHEPDFIRINKKFCQEQKYFWRSSPFTGLLHRVIHPKYCLASVLMAELLNRLSGFSIYQGLAAEYCP